jgi:hypothetical protein
LSCFGGLSFSVYDFEFGSQEDSQFNNNNKKIQFLLKKEEAYLRI